MWERFCIWDIHRNPKDNPRGNHGGNPRGNLEEILSVAQPSLFNEYCMNMSFIQNNSLTFTNSFFNINNLIQVVCKFSGKTRNNIIKGRVKVNKKANLYFRAV